MPSGAGIFYRKNGDHFALKPMLVSGKKVSLESLEWLTYESNVNGGIKIIHGLNHGEVKVAGYFVDGFFEGIIYGKRMKCVWEYNGCRFHDCSLCDTVSTKFF